MGTRVGRKEQAMAATARRYSLALITKNKKNPAYVGARLGADRVAARHGCIVTHSVPDKPDDVDEQRELLEDAYAQRPDALLIAPAHATALNATLRRMQADGIPIVCFVSRPEEIACTCFVGSDDRALARGIAEYLFDRLESLGNVVTLEGHPNAITTAPRAAGFRDAARGRGNIRIVNSRPGYFLRDGGYAGMTELLAAEPRIDGVLAANDFMALGALDAMRETGRKIPIVGVNATPEGVQAIKAGGMLASASFDAMKMACLAVEAAVRVLSGERVASELILPVEVIDRFNCGGWDLPYAQRPLPDWAAYASG
jgi:ABC-type sugar transport system substrate-binding protein